MYDLCVHDTNSVVCTSKESLKHQSREEVAEYLAYAIQPWAINDLRGNNENKSATLMAPYIRPCLSKPVYKVDLGFSVFFVRGL